MRRIPADYQLCLRVRDGEDWAFEELCRRHRDVLFHTASRYGAPGQTSEDIMQAARIGLFKAARLYTPGRGCTFRSYAGLSVKGEILTMIRSALNGVVKPLDDSDRFEQSAMAPGEVAPICLGDMIAGPSSDDPAEIVCDRETFEEQVAVVLGCTPLERGAVAHRLNGGTYSANHMPAADAKRIDNALMRARSKLRAAA